MATTTGSSSSSSSLGESQVQAPPPVPTLVPPQVLPYDDCIPPQIYGATPPAAHSSAVVQRRLIELFTPDERIEDLCLDFALKKNSTLVYI